MGFDEFMCSLRDDGPPAGVELALRALWYDARGREDSAMRAARSDDSHHGKRILAYLHRKAGNAGEAELWYWRAGATQWSGSVESEWEDIVKTVLTERVVANSYL